MIPVGASAPCGAPGVKRWKSSPTALRPAAATAARQVDRSTAGVVITGRAAAVATPDAASSGITGVVLLAESHLAVHTWPELEAATLDVYVCNLGADNSARAERLMESLLAAFAPARVERHAHRRGE